MAGWECKITGGACMYLIPNCTACARACLEEPDAINEDSSVDIYKNEDKRCECWKCEKSTTCNYKDRYQRLPRTSPGALGLCPKL